MSGLDELHEKGVPVYEEQAEQERARIVAWLRELAEYASPEKAHALKWAAAAIERGAATVSPEAGAV